MSIRWFASSLSRRMTAVFLVISVPLVIAISVLLVSTSSKVIIHEAYESGQLSLSVISSQLDLIFDAVERQSVLVVTDTTVQGVSDTRAGAGGYEEYAQIAAVRALLTRASEATGIIDAYSIAFVDGPEIWSSGSSPVSPGTVALDLIDDPAEYQSIRSAWEGIEISPYTSAGTRHQVVTYRRSFNEALAGKPMGVIEAFVRVDEIAGLFSSFGIGETGSINIIDSRGKGIKLPDDVQTSWVNDRGDSPGSLLGRNSIELSLPYKRFGWEIRSVVPVEELVRNRTGLLMRSIAILLGGVFITTLLIVRASKQISKPVEQLTTAARSVGEGDFSMRLMIRNRDELGVLAETFNSMVDKISFLVAEIAREERQKREHELELMTSQLNPHFLHNSLDALCGLAELGRTEELVSMVNDLSAFYEAVLSDGSVLISLQQELELTDRFVEILGVRYPEKFAYRKSVDERTKNVVLPKLTIQPLVENAIYHGLKPKPGGGRIDVIATVSPGRVQIRVKDDGVGFSVDENGLNADGSRPIRGSGGFGLRAVDERLKLYCGEESSLRIDSEPARGTEITISLPAKPQKNVV